VGSAEELLERQDDLRRIGAAIGDASAGHGRLVIVEGAAGTGKSALASAAAALARDAGLRVLRARGSEIERTFAFGAVCQLFEAAVAGAPDGERRRLLGGPAAPAEWVLAPGHGEDPDRSESHFAVLHAIHHLAANLAASGPVLIVVDDAHWADASSLRALGYMARRIEHVPITLLVALRPHEPGAPAALLDELRAEPGALMLTLRALHADSVARLVRAQLPQADDAVCAAFHDAGAGNPLYVRELLRAFRGDDLLRRPDPVAAVRAATVPSLGDRVVRRIASVDPDAPALATAMAVLGDGGRLATAADLAGIAEAEASRVAHRLRRIEVLSAEDPFAFVHPLVRASVYDRLPVAERDAAHVKASRLLRAAGAPAEAVAAHVAAVRPAGAAGAAATLVDAAREALARAAPDAAVRTLLRAVEEGAEEPPRAEILAELGFVEVTLRDMRAIGHLEEALALATDPSLRARVAVALSEILFNAGRWEAGGRVILTAAEELGDRESDEAVEVAAVWAVTTAYDPRLVALFDRDRSWLERLARRDGWAAHGLSALLAAVTACRDGRAPEVVALVDRALAGGRLLAERGAGAWASAQVLSALMAVDEHDRVAAVCDVLAEEARRCGSVSGAMTAVGYRSWMYARRGDLAAAEAGMRGPLDAVIDAGMPLMAASGVFYLQDAILERESLDDVAAFVEEAELEPVFLATVSGAMLLEVRGRLRLGRGDREAAVSDLRACGVTNAALRIGPSMSAWRSALALALPEPEADEASRLVSEELELARATGLARPQAVALRAAGLLAGGADGVERLRESVALLEDSPARLELARSLVELGAALRRRHRRTEARDRLAAGMDVARRCGADRLVARARDELRAAGARPRRDASTGPEALTAAELRVGRLAAAGRSNAEIARELYVSVKTVETHLSHAYAKLGLAGPGSRSALARALGAAAPA
jgi:DNA-binding CsgD family transcriptional regulator